MLGKECRRSNRSVVERNHYSKREKTICLGEGGRLSTIGGRKREEIGKGQKPKSESTKFRGRTGFGGSQNLAGTNWSCRSRLVEKRLGAFQRKGRGRKKTRGIRAPQRRCLVLKKKAR